MKELGPDEKSILDTILASDLPWVTVQSLPVNGVCLANLILEGLVEVWSTDCHNRNLIGGPFVTLTPLGCEVLGVTLVEYSETLPPQCKTHSKNDPHPFNGWFPHWDPVDPKTGWGIHENRPLRLIDIPWLRRVPLPESLIDPHPAPTLLTGDDEKPIRFFAGQGNGYTATIDHRLGRKPPTRHHS